MKFVRYGGVNRVSQKVYRACPDNFHAPPARKGVYAFNQKTVERYLLGGFDSAISETDFNDVQKGDYPFPEKTYKKYRKNVSKYNERKHNRLTKEGKPKNYREFDYNAEIWHHLIDFIKPHQILDRSGSWVLTTMSVYKKLFYKSYFCDVINTRRLHGYATSLDHFEVFIEKKF